ncbi:MAG TPA: septum formation initiator family protein [Patescibacteria group bacterium]|nr:septum formation initiator family protein [Patescibacteria group bacterium]
MKKLLFFSFLIISFGIIGGLINSIYTLWHKQDVLIEAQKQLIQEKKQHQKLEGQLKEVSTQQFVEEQARDKLFLLKQGENTVLISAPTPTGTPVSIKTTQPNWQQWVAVFFH